MRTSVLLIIDGQVDFMDLKDSALPVPGATADMDRVIKFIENNSKHLGAISSTLDSHRSIDISHPSFWSDKDGNPVAPFTQITYKDLQEGKFTANFDPKWAFEYVKKLEDQGEFPHFIWPYHCLIGSAGAALYAPLSKALNKWELENGRIVKYVTKGDNPYTEHFGAFRANIEIAKDPKTQFNQSLVKLLMEHDDVYFAGEAKSHCVVNTLRQAVTEVPALASKIVLLEDCMSDVTGLPAAFYKHVESIYNDAKAKGVRTAKSTDIIAAPAPALV